MAKTRNDEPTEGWVPVDREVLAHGWWAALEEVERQAEEACQALERDPAWQWCQRVASQPIGGRPAGPWDPPWWAGSHATDPLERMQAHVQHLTALADWAEKLARALRAEAGRQGQKHQRLVAQAARCRRWYRIVEHRTGVEVKVFVPPREPEPEEPS